MDTLATVHPAAFSAAARDCLNCGEGFTPRTGNQHCCSGACRVAYESRRRDIARQRPKPKRPCNWCGEKFEAQRQNHDHCSATCRHAFNNFAKSWGPRLVRALLGWRYFGRRLSLTDICQTASAMYDDLKRRRPKGGTE